MCYNRSVGNGQVMRCSGQCLGGCLTKDEWNKELKLSDTQDECFSCKNYLSPMKSEQFSNHGNHACWDRCSSGFVSVRQVILVLLISSKIIDDYNSRIMIKIFFILV